MTLPWIRLPVPIESLPLLEAWTEFSNFEPANTIETPEGFDPLVPGDIFSQLPYTEIDTYRRERTVGRVVAPYLVRELLQAVSRTKVLLFDMPYGLVQTDALLAAGTGTGLDLVSEMKGYEPLDCGAGGFVVSGQGIELRLERKIIGEGAAFGFSGSNAVLKVERLALAADAVEFLLSGQDAGRLLGKTLFGDAASFVVGGQDAVFLRPERLLAGEAGTFAFTGQAANLEYTSPAFSIVTYTGNGTTTNAVTGVGFKPGLVWTKRISTTATHHLLVATAWNVSTPTYYSASTSSTSNTSSSSELTTFDSDGFTIKSSTFNNTNAVTYIAWCLKEGGAPTSDTNGTITSSVSYNADLGFSNFTYQGNGSTTTVGHGISAGAPDFVFIKNMSATNAGQVGFSAINPNSLTTNSTAAKGTLSIFNGFNATTIGLTNNAAVNTNNSRYVGFAIKSVAGVSKVGTFTGDGNATQAITGVGFEPQFVLVKSYLNGTSDWVMFTASRDGRFLANTSAVEAVTDYITFDSDGFTLESGASVNTSGVSYIYLAFA